MRPLLVITACVAAVIVSTGSAMAANPYPTPEPGRQYCVVRALPAPEAASASPIIGSGCFSDPETARTFGETGSLAPTPAGQIVPLASVLLGVSWTGIAQSGSALSFYGPAKCANGVNYNFPNFQSPWNNNFESTIIASANCKNAVFYDNGNLTGFLITCYVASGGSQNCVTSMGSANNRASSVRYTGAP